MYGCAGSRENAARRADFGRAAGIEHQDIVANLRRQPQVVGDEDHRRAVLLLHLGNELHDARLDGDVERGGRLVRDQQLGTAGECHGDQHALAHAAGQLVRVFAEQFGRPIQMHGVEHGKRVLAPRLAVADMQAREVFIDLVSDGQHRIEPRQRLLRHKGDLTSEQFAARVERHSHQVLTIEHQFAAGDRKSRRHELRDRPPDHRLAGAGFADQPKDAAGR